MEDIISNKNIIYLEEEAYKYSIGPKFRGSSHRVLQQNITGKSCEKTKKICDDLSLTDNEIIKQELKLCLGDQSDDVADLIIKNDVDFKLKNKEKTVVSINNNNSVKIKNVSKLNTNGDKKQKVSDNYNEIIEIKCKHKLLENTSPELQCKKDILKSNQSEIDIKYEKELTFSSDPKSDLQSLLIMTAVSTTHNDGEKSNLQADDGDKISYNLEYYIKKENNKAESFKKSIDDQNISDVLRIEMLKPISHNENSIIRKYVNKWLNYVSKRKENDRQNQRLTTINKFFEKLERKKASLNQIARTTNKARLQAHDYSTYQHRYKVQKHIIALQKAKLEQQNRLIEELKYNKIIEASRQSLDFMKEDVRLTYWEIDKHLKPKIKCLTNELKIREIEDNSLVLHCLKVPQFLQRMEARAREREEKHAMIRERRKQMEEERVRIKQEAELAKAEMDKEEKLKRIIELREKRRREKVENIRKKQYAERLKALIVMADIHYEKNLTAKYGIRPFKLLLKIKKDNMEKARAHYQFQMKKYTFLNWMWYTEDMWYERNFKADDFYRRKLLQKAFNCFKKNHNEYLIKLQVAKDYYDLYVTQLVLKKFQEGILVLKKEFAVKWSTAATYYNSNLLFKTLTCWRTLPALNALKREQDARKMRWREKVLQVVPDYVPPEE